MILRLEIRGMFNLPGVNAFAESAVREDYGTSNRLSPNVHPGHGTPFHKTKRTTLGTSASKG